MSDRLDLSTVPAAWPSGMPQLVLAIYTCQRCDAGGVCADWLARAPNKFAVPPAFCPNSKALTRNK
jgi:hypothetical protein